MELISPIVRRYQADALADPEAFWGDAAGELPWLRRWERVFVPEPPSFRWFEGALTNLCWQAVDVHVEAGEGGRSAIVYVNERGDQRVLTYAQLRHQVRRASARRR